MAMLWIAYVSWHVMVSPFHSDLPGSNKTGLALNQKQLLISDNCEKSGRKNAASDFSNTEKVR
jgi:hypothetical protein